MEEYFDDAPDYDVEDMRNDFFEIWKRNIIQLDLIRETNPLAGDYFSDDTTSGTQTRKIWVNVQGITTDAYKQLEAGISSPEAEMKCFVRWDEDIENLDILKLGSYYYRIKNFNKAFFNGQYVFKDFSIYLIDKENV